MGDIVSKHKWINAQDRLPDKDAAYLIFAPSMDKKCPLIAIAWYQPGIGWNLLPNVWRKAITHWMPLPKPPKKKRLLSR
jgi:hypothetical protein